MYEVCFWFCTNQVRGIKKRVTHYVRNSLIFSGLAGIRTQGPYIKSVLLYQLSYQTDCHFSLAVQRYY